ncbi:Crp/Fnr family transcriptional regulator [Flavobacterium sp. NKUCC04_CG]|uniref:Crp/Fnr family transcriptional regulator n=1 Tax=Flavobacterium sp. NKUCC04_CG TaxID=2842121 RepID=UPI001C5B7C0D|nr:cyclic nucleotide-binding domain-containing protein [Flavobacterium sp. NKUCC04_CG]MBW3519825.1 cyclic nucleotide-binding domain-containing protein [Flavobacterium sp. NKUCC04_CG]
MKEYLASLNILSTSELNQIDAYIVKRTVEKAAVLLEENKVCRELMFVVSGVLRSYYWNYKGEQVTSCIAFDNEFMAAYPSFIQQQKSQETIHALQHTEIEAISFENLEKLYDSSMAWQKIGRKLVENQYVFMNQHFTEFQQQNGSHRYEYLLKNYSKQLNLIPQHYIASYLGISTRQLTRIRKSLL